MIWEGLNEDLVITDLKAETSEDVFRELGGQLIDQGYSKDSFIDALIEREKNFPTGINMGEFGIAMPHTDRAHVNRSAVAIGRLVNPVRFYQMGTLDEEVSVKLVFMLAVEDPNAHMDFLQRILKILQDQEVLDMLLKADSKSDMIQIIKEKESKL